MTPNKNNAENDTTEQETVEKLWVRTLEDYGLTKAQAERTIISFQTHPKLRASSLTEEQVRDYISAAIDSYDYEGYDGITDGESVAAELKSILEKGLRGSINGPSTYRPDAMVTVESGESVFAPGVDEPRPNVAHASRSADSELPGSVRDISDQIQQTVIKHDFNRSEIDMIKKALVDQYPENNLEGLSKQLYEDLQIIIDNRSITVEEIINILESADLETDSNR